MFHGRRLSFFFLNIFCLLIISFFTLFAARQLSAAVMNGDTDFAVLYHAIHEQNKPYDVYYSASVTRMLKENQATKIWVSKINNEVNLNTPGMTLIIKYLMTVSNKINISVLLWILSALLGAAVSIAFIVFWLDPSAKSFYFPALLLLWLSWPNLYNLNQGEIALILLPLLCIGFLCDELKKLKSAAVILGLLASLKLFFLIFSILYIVRKQWFLLTLFLISFISFFIIPKLFFTWHDYQNYFRILSDHAFILQRAIAQMNGSILGVVGNFFRLSSIKMSVNGIFLITVILTLITFIIWFLFDGKYINKLPLYKNAIRFSFLIVLALIGSPLGWLYYFLFLLIPVAVFFKITKHNGFSTTTLVYFIVALILPCFCFVDLANKSILFQSIRALVLFLSLLSWLMCLRSLTLDMLFKKNLMQSTRVIVSILLVNLLLSVFFLSIDSRMNYILQWHKQNYFKNVAPTIWVNYDT